MRGEIKVHEKFWKRFASISAQLSIVVYRQ